MKSPTNNAGSGRAPSARGIAETTVAWAQGLGRNDDLVRQVELEARRARRRRLVAAGGIAAGLLVLGLVVPVRWGGDGGRTASTASVSLPERQTLPDGSVIELRAGAKITAAFAAEGAGVRRVILERGEAHFSVRANSARPFVVQAGGVEVRAVGTAFSVAFGPSQVAVLVTAGRVAVEHAPLVPADSAQPDVVATVDAGRGLLVALESSPARPPAPIALAAEEVAERLSWRAPRIRFSNTPLVEAVQVFNRHSAARLVLDPELGGLRIGGSVRADNTDSFLLLLSAEFGITPEDGADGTVRLRRR